MEKFSKALHGYDPKEVNQFLDNVIMQVEKIINASKIKDEHILRLEKEKEELTRKLAKYQNMDETLRQAVMMTQKTSEQMKLNSIKEAELIINDAKRNANRIVNEALLKADATEKEAEVLRRNINIFKRKLKDQLQAQLDMVDEIEKVDL